MKRSILIFTFFFSLMALTQSCKKEEETTVIKDRTINATIKKNQSYQYNFGLIGIEDGLDISSQASHSNESTLNRDNSGKIIYTYQPRLDYTGTDRVEITYSMSNGASVVSTSKTIIKLNITE